jgi:hypothetical protein
LLILLPRLDQDQFAAWRHEVAALREWLVKELPQVEVAFLPTTMVVLRQ